MQETAGRVAKAADHPLLRTYGPRHRAEPHEVPRPRHTLRLGRSSVQLQICERCARAPRPYPHHLLHSSPRGRPSARLCSLPISRPAACAPDGECDDPSGTGLCRLGTDDADCCPAHSHSISTTHCEVSRARQGSWESRPHGLALTRDGRCSRPVQHGLPPQQRSDLMRGVFVLFFSAAFVLVFLLLVFLLVVLGFILFVLFVHAAAAETIGVILVFRGYSGIQFSEGGLPASGLP